MENNFKVHGALLLVGLIYGANYSIAKNVMPEPITPFAFILVRVSLATLLFWIFHAFTTQEKIRSRKDYLRLMACSVFGVAANQLMFFKGLSITSTISASVIMTMSPVIVLITSHFLIHEKITRRKLLGIFLGGTGAILLITREGIDLSSNTFIGDFLILMNATSYSIYLVMVKPLMKVYRALTIVKWVFFFGLILIIPFGFSEFMQISWSTFPVEGWLSIAYVVIGTTFLAYLLNAWALKFVNASIVGYYIYLQPLFATIIALMFLNEPFTLQIAGFATLIFLGVWLVSRR